MKTTKKKKKKKIQKKKNSELGHDPLTHFRAFLGFLLIFFQLDKTL